MEKSSYRNCETCAKKDHCTNRLNCLCGVIPLLWKPGINYEPPLGIHDCPGNKK